MATTEETQLLYIADWSGISEERLLVMWRKPKIRALLRALAEGVQISEDHTFDLVASTGIDESTGDSLDQWGELVGEDRGPLGDNEYRPFIKARMLVNRSDGTVDSLIEILTIAAGPVVDVLHLDNFPAGFYLQVLRTTFLTDESRRRVARMMEDSRPGGRHMTVIEALSGGYGFDEDADAAGFNVGPWSRLLAVA